MDFDHSAKAADYIGRMRDFLDTRILPAEEEYEAYRREKGREDHTLPPVVEELKVEARERGLWNLFLPDVSGMTNVEYAAVAEITGWSSHIAPEAINCDAPNTGNMEVLHMFGTPEQKSQWLEPLLEGQIRSAFAMTEPDVASSDATNIATSIVRDGDEYVINGRKWWTSGINDPRCRIMILMGKTDTSQSAHRQQSMILVPTDTPGVEIVRALPVFGYQDQHGHGEVRFTDVRVPAANLIANEGDGFMIAQARLGPGRIHHCMRAIGAAERALKLMCERAMSRVAFGQEIAKQGVVREQIAESRMEIDQARLMVLKTADMIDKVGAKGARSEIAAIKVIAPRVALNVVDRAIQVHGGAGVSEDFPLARMYAGLRTLRIADGPDEVHVRTVARQELGKYS
ncbi:MAG: Acyl-CoA dehydrogenase [uncultured Frankineae bacterium]|uniref:Acyl-CoA dehydrogenase n=1 Tax=uncultured Frankineae bacterium TaxID=437475 RepID=A0A6J4LLH4_9ACTN|nr:MAG: Acyl-CoA dehydrogenase [uncultured Frankineae bacterium]